MRRIGWRARSLLWCRLIRDAVVVGFLRLVAAFPPVFRDAVFFGGIILVAHGAWRIYEPAGEIVLGAEMLGFLFMYLFANRGEE